MLDAVVIGAGITGLTLAYRLLRQGKRIAIFEQKTSPGGYLTTFRQDHWLSEYAATGFIANATGALPLCRELGVELCPSNRNNKRRYIYCGGVLHPVPTSPAQLVRSQLLSGKGKARLLQDVVTGPGSERESVFDLAKRRWGQEVAERLISPFVVGVFAGDAHELGSTDAFPSLKDVDQWGGIFRFGLHTLRQRLQAKDKPERGLWSPVLGMGSLIEALTKQVGPSLHLGSEVIGISDHPDGGFAVMSSNGTVLTKSVTFCTPAKVANKLLATVLVPEPTAVSVAAVSLGYERSAVGHPLDGFGFLCLPSENQEILGAVFESSIWPGRASADHALVRVMVGGGIRPELATKSPSQLTELAHRKLAKILSIRHQPIFHHVAQAHFAIPQYTAGHREAVQKRQADLAPRKIFLAGAHYLGVSVNECVAQANRCAQAIGAALALFFCWNLIACSQGAPSTSVSKSENAVPQLAEPPPVPSKIDGDDDTEEVGNSEGPGRVKVEWVWPPAKLVASTQVGACGELPGPLVVDTMGGISGAVVESAINAPTEPSVTAISVTHCGLDARVLTGRVGGNLEITLADTLPHSITVKTESDGITEQTLFVPGEKRSLRLATKGVLRIEDATAGTVSWVYITDKYALVTGKDGWVSFPPVGLSSSISIWHPPLKANKPVKLNTSIEVSHSSVVDVAKAFLAGAQ